MRKREITISYNEYSGFDELETDYQELIKSARRAAEKAYAPYSKFSVGAAVRLYDGTIITGNNQENSAYPNGMCAERVALYYAHAQYPDQPITCIAVSATRNGQLIGEPIKPCGGCRQAIAEIEHLFNRPIMILLDGCDQMFLFEGIKNLLPFSFSKIQ